MGDPPEPAARPKPNATMLDAVATAYYTRAVDAPHAARSRAQAAYVIAGAVATAVVTAGAFTDLSSRPLSIQIVGLLAFVAWLATAGLFMVAVAAPHSVVPKKKETQDARTFVETVLELTANERNAIDHRQFYARLAAALASALTVAAVALGVFLPPATSQSVATVRLGVKSRAALSSLCGKRVRRHVQGEIDSSSLDDGTVNFSPSETACPRGGTTSLPEDETTYLLAP